MLLYIAFAFQNISGVRDSNIRVVVQVIQGKIVAPNKNLVADDCKEFRGQLCKDDKNEDDLGVIGELFQPPCDSIIRIDDENYITDFRPKELIPDGFWGYRQPAKDEDDYGVELEIQYEESCLKRNLPKLYVYCRKRQVSMRATQETTQDNT